MILFVDIEKKAAFLFPGKAIEHRALLKSHKPQTHFFPLYKVLFISCWMVRIGDTFNN